MDETELAGWIRWGPAPGNMVHRDTAADMLRQLHREDPQRFGRFVAIALTGVAPRGGARKGEDQ